jgi:hypothetical protein
VLHVRDAFALGLPLTEVPRSYLYWLLRECDLSEWLEAAVRAALHDSDDRPPPPQVAPPDGVLSRWYSVLVRRWHPDRGGSVEAMQAINDARDLLVEMLSEVTV